MLFVTQHFTKKMARHPFYIDAIVHARSYSCDLDIIPNDADYSIRWGNIKRSFSLTIHQDQRPKVFASRQHKQAQAIGQQHFWEHRFRDGKYFNQHIDYIHYNPVKNKMLGYEKHVTQPTRLRFEYNLLPLF